MDNYIIVHSPVKEEDGGFSIGAEIGHRIDIEYALKNESLDIGTKLQNGRSIYIVSKKSNTGKLYLRKLK